MDTAGKRRNTTLVSQLTEGKLREIQKQANISDKQLEQLNPYFDELESLLHKKWAELPLDDGASAKTVKFQLYTVKKLREIMLSKVNKGKQATAKLEGV